MPTAVEQIHTKIAQLEAQSATFHRRTRAPGSRQDFSATNKDSPNAKSKAEAGPKAKREAAPRPRGPKAASGQTQPGQPWARPSPRSSANMALPAAEVAERIKATGRDIDNRSSPLPCRSLKSAASPKTPDGKWTAATRRGRKSSVSPGRQRRSDRGLKEPSAPAYSKPLASEKIDIRRASAGRHRG